ncbi:hypothetical protein C4J81_17160 [Deltaproteobacteria bacterium Smac51]|nr:hypothetical protein C4J81_17160 [Deltaproteobacteria bacterium Smac51]
MSLLFNENTESDFRKLLKRPEGRRVLLLILRQSGLMAPSFSVDMHSTAYNEGLRAMGIWLKNIIDQIDPAAFARMLAEESRRKE